MEEQTQLGMSFQSWWLGEKYFSSLYKFNIFDLKLLKDVNCGTSHQCFYSNSAEETNMKGSNVAHILHRALKIHPWF